ncbi:MAG: hypothetical protein R3290_10840 [Acidimicrobiia bacterium]|nr:hypothetical protein [Acidimicrobiia bacterium]
MANSIMKGRRPGRRRGRSLERDEEARRCAHDECSTVLSAYNLSERCFRHRPRRFPRVIGRRKKKFRTKE